MQLLKSFIFIIAFSFFFTSPLVVWSHDDVVMREKRHEKLVQELGLTADQSTKLKSISEKFHTQMKSQKEALKKAHDELNAALKSEVSDADIRTKFSAFQALKNKKDEVRLEKILEIRAILTKEQRIKFEGFKPHGYHGPHGNPGRDKM